MNHTDSISLDYLLACSDYDVELLEQQLDLLISSWQIANLRATAWRFHDDQHINDGRRELYADKHPNLDYATIKKSRAVATIDCLEGNTLIHPVTTPIIEVSRDNRQARALFLSFGYEALSVHGEEPMAIWSMGYNPENVVWQDGEWRLLCGGWQRTVKADMHKGWVRDMQKTNTRPPLTVEQDRQNLGKYAYQKEEARQPVPAPPLADTFEAYPGESNLEWTHHNREG